ncbi:MAG TPA: serine/threonine-protein kinase [Amnibacterium sp.]|nr:serine/threonine-protein kinase [Amnibacterium sp.]
MPVERPCTGALIDGRYRVGALLGRGGAADVWRATDVVTGVDVALKAFREDAAIAVDPDRAARETAATQGVHHPAVVEVLGTCAEPTCLVLELVEGEDLGALLLDGPLPAETVREIGADIADALAVLHARRLVHRDVKPGNILVPERPGPVAAKLTDFGIVAALDGARLTATDAILGTAAYLSPEQVAGGAVGTAGDVYSLGLVLLESLTGARAFPGGLAESAVARLNRPPRLPDDASPGLASLLAAMTALDPAARPHATEVARALRELAGGMTGEAPATAVVVRMPAVRIASAPAGRPPALTRLVGAAAAVAVVLGTGMALLADGRAPVAVPAADGTAAVAPAVVPSTSPPLPRPTPTRTAALHAVLAAATTSSAHPGATHTTRTERHAAPSHAAPPERKHGKPPTARPARPGKPGRGGGHGEGGRHGDGGGQGGGHGWAGGHGWGGNGNGGGGNDNG